MECQAERCVLAAWESRRSEDVGKAADYGMGWGQGHQESGQFGGLENSALSTVSI